MNTTAPPAPQGMTIEQAMAEAHARWDAGQAQHAEMLCQQVLAAWPGHSDALHLLGLMAYAFGNIDSAIDHLRRACQTPRPPAAYFANLSEMCRQRGLLGEAEQAGRRSVALEPGFIAGWNNLGIALQEAGKLDESLACLQRVVQFRPDDALARNNLANTYKRLGKLTEARREYEAALRLAPDYAEGHSNLANLLSDLGEPDAALASARRAMDANPRLVGAYINAVGVETGRRRYEEALRWADALLTFEPMNAGGLTARSLVLRHLDRHEEAVAAGRLAAAATPNDSEALNALGEALQALGRPEEALQAYDKAAAGTGFATEKAAVNRSVLMMEQGDKAQAREAVDQALAAYPRAAFGWLTLSDLKRFKADDADLQKMEALLGPGGVEARADRMALHFALGKAWMDAGDAPRAFAHMNLGNRMHRETYVFDGDATEAWVKGLGDLYDAALYERLAGAGAASEAPVFVLGMPRSGTTLVEQILASHPKVHGAGELSLMNQLVGPHGGVDRVAATLTPKLAKSLGQGYIDQITALGGGKARVVDKMPANFLMRGLIPLMLPGARIIHVRRDPVDTCLSCYSKHFASEQMFTYDQTELGQFYRAYDSLMARWRETLPQDRYIEVAYEDVVDDLEGQARRMIDFLGLEWNEACLSFDKTRRTVRTASVNQVREPIFKTSVGRWKPYADELKPLLNALGVAAREPGRMNGPAQTLEVQAHNLLVTRRFAEAEALLRQALASGSGPLPLWRMLANALRGQGRAAEARPILEMLVNAVPGDLPLRFDLAENLLLLGEFERGWREYHYRYQLPHTTRIERKVQKPRWNGQPIPGRTLLIHDEQGYGDTFQFMRLVAQAKAQSQARVVLEVNRETYSLAQRMGGFDAITIRGDLPPPFDLHCEMMSLPMAMGLKLADLPGKIPYLTPDPDRLKAWRKRLKGLARPLICLVWAGRPTHVNDANRSMRLDLLAPLAKSGATFLSIQKGPTEGAAAAPPPGMTLVNLSPEINDFEDTAAILMVADLLISVDSSPIHLAGALGRPAWIMLPFVPDWRWLEKRGDTPWYPKHRLFRQTVDGDWPGVVEQVAQALASCPDLSKA